MPPFLSRRAAVANKVRRWLRAVGRVPSPARVTERLRSRPRLEALEDRFAPASLGNPIANGSAYPYSAATKIYSYYASTGSWFEASGTLIDSYHVLTAGHVVYDSNPSTAESGWADKVFVLPGYSGYNGNDFDAMVPYGLAQQSFLTVPSGYTTDDNAIYDLGLITLDRPVGDITGWLGWEQQDEAFFDSQPTLNILHYPAETGSDDGRTLYQGSGTVAGADGDVFWYNFEDFKLTEHGSSGGGIYRYDPNTGDRYVVGVVSRGGATQDTDPYIDEVWGPALTDWLDDHPKPTSKPDLVDYDWFFNENSGGGADWHPWMRTNDPDHSSISSSTPLSGGSFSATATIYNTGTANATGVKVSFYLSSNTTISTSDIYLGDRFVDVSATNWAQTTWSGNLPSGVTGSYYVGWLIDPDNTVSEYGYGSSTADAGHDQTLINIQPVASQLNFSLQPSSAAAGSSLGTVSVRVEDVNGSLVTSGSRSVTLSVTGSAATLLGTTTVTSVNGVATFSGLSITKAGTYTLTATSSGLSGDISNTFTISPAAAHHLAFGQQPTTELERTALSPAVTVRVLDQYNNQLTSGGTVVSVSLGNSRGATLGGSTAVSSVSGVATFSSLTVNRAGRSYSLTASSSGLTGTTSSSFDVTAPPDQTFIIGLDNQVYSQKLDANGNPVGGYFLVKPGTAKAIAVARDATGKPLLFTIGSNDLVYQLKFDAAGNAVGGYTLTRNGTVKAIAAGQTPSGNPLLFAIGTNNHVYQQKFDGAGNSLTAWTLTRAGTVKDMHVASDGLGRPELFVIGLDDQIYAQKFDANGTSVSNYFLTRGGKAKALTVGRDGSGRPLIFIIGTDDQVYGQKFDVNGNSASPYYLTRVGKFKGVTLAQTASGNPLLFEFGLDDRVYVQKFDAAGNSITGNALLNAGTIKGLTVAQTSNNRPQLLVIGGDDRIYSMFFDDAGTATSGFVLTGGGKGKIIAVTP